MFKAEIEARAEQRRGRPRAELTEARRAQLTALAEEVASAEARATQARLYLQRGMGEAHAEGASVRVIAEVVGLSPGRVQAVLTGAPGE
jgi:hypothetical protein